MDKRIFDDYLNSVGSDESILSVIEPSTEGMLTGKSCKAKKKPTCARKQKKCSKPIMNNGYLNFVRAYREKHSSMKPQELIRRAARAWCRLSEEKKNIYRRMACKVTTSERHKRRKVCNPEKCEKY
ncbi:protamine-like [Drosophila bipectinata]|uniref:protamine-like n=1 Tax=Drosophila bipectinata TaxID=42026 RepID=UPI0038B32DCF